MFGHKFPFSKNGGVADCKIFQCNQKYPFLLLDGNHKPFQESTPPLKYGRNFPPRHCPSNHPSEKKPATTKTRKNCPLNNPPQKPVYTGRINVGFRPIADIKSYESYLNTAEKMVVIRYLYFSSHEIDCSPC